MLRAFHGKDVLATAFIISGVNSINLIVQYKYTQTAGASLAKIRRVGKKSFWDYLNLK